VAGREGIIRDATAALATARPAQSSMIRRNPKTNAWLMAARMADDVWIQTWRHFETAEPDHSRSSTPQKADPQKSSGLRAPESS
jgi:hypothetical protein